MGSVRERIEVVRGDLVVERVDAIVNAANAALSGGGGVDGAIHRAAGPELLRACRPLGRCAPGGAVVTPGFALHAKHVIHAVGPVWRGGSAGEDQLLASCHRAALEIVDHLDLQTVSFPSISCGAYRFPVRRAAPIAVNTVAGWLAAHDHPRSVRFVCFEARTFRAFRDAVDDLL
jgi:O-acetyl-ADP-ribose deacetylase (regulator of RNase III)